MVIRYNGDICTVHETEHRTPGNKRGFVQAKMRNHRSGAMVEQRLASGDFVTKVMLESEEMQYLEVQRVHECIALFHSQNGIARTLVAVQLNDCIERA